MSETPLNRPAIIAAIYAQIDRIEWDHPLPDRPDRMEEQLDCLDELMEAVKSDAPDKSIDDLAFNLGLDGCLYWHKEKVAQ